MICIWRHGGHVGGATQKNMLLIPLSDPAGMGGWRCLSHPERLIANQEYVSSDNHVFPNNASFMDMNKLKFINYEIISKFY